MKEIHNIHTHKIKTVEGYIVYPGQTIYLNDEGKKITKSSSSASSSGSSGICTYYDDIKTAEGIEIKPTKTEHLVEVYNDNIICINPFTVKSTLKKEPGGIVVQLPFAPFESVIIGKNNSSDISINNNGELSFSNNFKKNIKMTESIIFRGTPVQYDADFRKVPEPEFDEFAKLNCEGDNKLRTVVVLSDGIERTYKKGDVLNSVNAYFSPSETLNDGVLEITTSGEIRAYIDLEKGTVLNSKFVVYEHIEDVTCNVEVLENTGTELRAHVTITPNIDISNNYWMDCPVNFGNELPAYTHYNMYEIKDIENDPNVIFTVNETGYASINLYHLNKGATVELMVTLKILEGPIEPHFEGGTRVLYREGGKKGSGTLTINKYYINNVYWLLVSFNSYQNQQETFFCKDFLNGDLFADTYNLANGKVVVERGYIQYYGGGFVDDEYSFYKGKNGDWVLYERN
jgi:hypothetical protein